MEINALSSLNSASSLNSPSCGDGMCRLGDHLKPSNEDVNLFNEVFNVNQSDKDNMGSQSTTLSVAASRDSLTNPESLLSSNFNIATN